MIEAVILVVFPFAMLHAAISDMLSMTIINRVSLLLIVAFLLVAPATGLSSASHFLLSVPWAEAMPS
jgi:prepilin peptidase CpaA